jgi:DNA modification methylase
MRPYYSDETVTLYLGDCREVTEWLAADVLVTDPPYGIAWTSPSTRSGHRTFVHKGIAGDHDASVRDEALRLWGTRPGLVFGSLDAPYPADWRKMLVFEKPRCAGLIGQRMPWFKNWEPVFVMGTWPDQTPTRSAVVRTVALSASGYIGYASRTGHPHTKPLDVMEQLVDACPHGVIADPFAGSGSTLVAARNLGRRAIGVEIEERYCETIAKRLQQDVLPLGSTA